MTLSPDTQVVIDRLFVPGERDAVRLLMEEECGNNLFQPAVLDPVALERYRFAALRISGGDLGKLREAIALAELDWRDLLMQADFGHDLKAHRAWFERGADPGPVRHRT